MVDRPSMGTRARENDLPTPNQSHRFANVFIVGFLLVQLFLPARYYASEDAHEDERFAWRMFSSLGRQTCRVTIREQRDSGDDSWRRVDLRADYQGTWITLLKRKRPLVVHKVLASRCEADDSLRAAEYRRECTTTAGKKLAPSRIGLDCRTGEYDDAHGQP